MNWCFSSDLCFVQIGVSASRADRLGSRLCKQTARLRMYKSALISVVDEKAALEMRMAVSEAEVSAAREKQTFSTST
jgi:hypothetical protein